MRVGFGLGAIWSGLLLEERRDVQQHAAVGLGGDRTAKARPVESADATLFMHQFGGKDLPQAGKMRTVARRGCELVQAG